MKNMLSDSVYSLKGVSTRNVFKKERWRNFEIDYFSMLKDNSIMTQLAAEALVKTVYINKKAK